MGLKGDTGAGLPSGRSIATFPRPGCVNRSFRAVWCITMNCPVTFYSKSFASVASVSPLPPVPVIQALPLLSIAMPLPLSTPV